MSKSNLKNNIKVKSYSCGGGTIYILSVGHIEIFFDMFMFNLSTKFSLDLYMKNSIISKVKEPESEEILKQLQKIFDDEVGSSDHNVF